MIIDQSGKIVYTGHPVSRNLESDIEKLLAGRSLTGEGTTILQSEEDD